MGLPVQALYKLRDVDAIQDLYLLPQKMRRLAHKKRTVTKIALEDTAYH